jgi:hypothetical protein
MGLLDGFSDFAKTPEGQGLLAATFGGLASAQRGAPINSLGRAGLAGLAGYGNAQDRDLQAARAEQQRKYQEQVMAHTQMQMDAAKRDAERKATIDAGMGKFFTPAQQAMPALPSMDGMLPAEFRTGAAPMSAQAAKPAGFDAGGAAQFLAQNGDYEGAFKLMPKPKELAVNKLDVKDFTPASVQKFAQTGSYADLVRLDKAQFQNTGGATMALDPFTGLPLNVIKNTQSPDSMASNALGWANNGISRERLNFDKQSGADGVKPKLVGDQWVTAPSDMKSGEVRSAMPSVAKKDAIEALDLIKSARKIIPESTGSYFGAGVDQVGRFFGGSTGGDIAAAQLKALEGALISKMPKMSGPQSDKDVALYKQMAGEIGDATIPQSRKLAALKTIEEIQQRHSGVPATPANITPTNAPTMRWNPKTKTLEMVN